MKVLDELNQHSHIRKLNVTENEIHQVAEIFIKIGEFFNIEFACLQVTKADDKFSQKMDVTSFKQIFEIIRKTNVHQNVNSTSYESAFPKVVKEDICKCSFHNEELFEHLIICSIISGIMAIRKKVNLFNIMLSAILHDIGKPACIRIFDSGNIGYPYHGEYGSLILSRIYNTNFEKFISKSDYEIMIRTISVHMCSYHITDFQPKWNQERLNSTRIESDEVKSYLDCLSYGDVYGAFPMSHITNDNKFDFIKSRDDYLCLINQPFTRTKSKVVFIVRGRSGSGKSYISSHITELMKSLGLSVCHIQRDIIIANVVRQMMQLPEIDVRPTNDEYTEYYTSYKTNKLGQKVNEQFKSKIQYAIDTFDAIIIDTQMTMFRGVEQIIPSNIENCVCIGIDVSRNIELIDDNKNGVNINEQLSMFGMSSALFPFDLTGVSIFSMSSSFTHNSKPIGLSCDYVFAIGYNSQFYNSNSIGLNYFANFMKRFIAIESSNTVITDTNNMSLEQIVNHIFEQNEQSYEKLVEYFKSQFYQAGPPHQLKDTPYKNMFLSIKYLEHNNNWNKWGRQSRGTTLMLIDGKWKIIKYLMQRGAEMLTGMQVKRGIDSTDNIDTKMDFKASHLDSDQQALIQDLRVGNNIDLVVSFKKDGSLLSCALYTGEIGKIMREIILNHCDEFTIEVMKAYDEISGNNDVFVFQSQSTLFIGGDMQDYTTTAIFSSKKDDLFNVIKPIDKIKKYGKDFFERMCKLMKNIPGNIKLVLGETICANRQESYSGKIHKELAMSYDQSSFTILSSTSIDYVDNLDNLDNLDVRPHYKFSDVINDCGLIEPAFWYVKNVAYLDELIQSVDKYIFKKITKDEFYSNHVPSNVFNYEKVIDCEGFVTYDEKRYGSYGKIKTDSYYKSHKIREDNVEFLCQLAKVAGNIFPLAKTVDDVVTNIDKKLENINKNLIKMIESDEFVKKLNELNPKAANGFEKRPKMLKFKIIINTMKDFYATETYLVFQNEFESLKQCQLNDDIKTFIVNYSMKSELWLDVSKKIDEDLKAKFVMQLINI
jgi:predicted ABC-type ATPase